MASILSQTLAFICFAIGILHIYWAFDGQWGRLAVIPSKKNGDPLFQIGPISCLLVASLLLGLSYFYMINSSRYIKPLGSQWSSFMNTSILIVALGFLSRAIGDFKYAGFFKSIRNTQFGRLDSKYFSPLCLLLGLASLALYFLS